ncbi:hypothetical protein IH601_07630 [Candidatus Bipolaricaulota bacterium]|nr:hypothetical protein [Candidatus Bipolaricaulota bacterium]
MRRVPWIAVFLCLSMLASAVQASETIPVPVGTPPIMDGTLSSGEWDDALPFSLSADFTLFLKHAQGYLFLGI